MALAEGALVEAVLDASADGRVASASPVLVGGEEAGDGDSGGVGLGAREVLVVVGVWLDLVVVGWARHVVLLAGGERGWNSEGMAEWKMSVRDNGADTCVQL